MPNYKISNNNNREEIYPDSKIKININKRYSFNIKKDINLSNIRKDYKEKIENNSKNKEKKISKLLNINLNINLNPKLSDGNLGAPLGSLFVNKKNKDEVFSSTTYFNNTNTKKKKYETKTVKSLNNLDKSIDNKNNYLRMHNLSQNLNYEFPEKSQGINIKNKDIQIKENNHENKEYNYNKKNIIIL